MLLDETFRSTGPPPPGLVPISGGTITVPEPTKPAVPPVKAPLKAPARETEGLPTIVHSTYKPHAPKTIHLEKLPRQAGGASAFAAHVIASQENDAESIPAPKPIGLVDQPSPQEPEKEVSLRHPPPSEPLAQRTLLQLSGQELKIVQQLSALDREVRAHERAHVAAASGITGSPRFSYVTGPDAQRYAVSGEVKIDTRSEPGDPEATIIKMEQVKKAALAPAQPSGQDKSVASAAEAKIRDAQAEIRAIKRDEEEQVAIDASAKKGEDKTVEPIVHATIQRANLAFSNLASSHEPSTISIEPLFA